MIQKTVNGSGRSAISANKTFSPEQQRPGRSLDHFKA